MWMRMIDLMVEFDWLGRFGRFFFSLVFMSSLGIWVSLLDGDLADKKFAWVGYLGRCWFVAIRYRYTLIDR
jgi:hypothetical protein